MKSIITTALLLSTIFSYGQRKHKDSIPDLFAARLSTLERVNYQSSIDSLRLWIDKVDHMYFWLGQQRDALWNLSRAVDILQSRIEVLEKRPFTETDSTKRIIAPTPYSTTGRMIDALDSSVKLLPKPNCKP